MVFGVALSYIEQHYHADHPSIQVKNGKKSYSLAQHMLRIAYFILHTWFMRTRTEDRPSYIPFIATRLLAANKDKERLDSTTIVCLDSIARYAYGNADLKVTPSFMYKSVICPKIPDSWRSLRQSWPKKVEVEMENVEDIQAWKVGTSIVTVSVLKEPRGWIRITSRRLSCYVEMLGRVEGTHVSLVNLSGQRPVEDKHSQQTLDIDEVCFHTVGLLVIYIFLGISPCISSEFILLQQA